MSGKPFGFALPDFSKLDELGEQLVEHMREASESRAKILAALARLEQRLARIETAIDKDVQS